MADELDAQHIEKRISYLEGHLKEADEILRLAIRDAKSAAESDLPAAKGVVARATHVVETYRRLLERRQAELEAMFE